MPDQSQIDQEASGNDLEQRVRVLEDTIATLRRNLLEPAMTRPGLLRFGGNADQLDNFGMQIRAPGAGSTPRPAIYFVPELRATNPSLTYPLSVIQGYATDNTAPTLDAADLELGASAASDLGSALFLQTGITGGGFSLARLSATNSDGTAYVQIAGVLGDKYVEINNATLRLASFTADPATLADGDIWYRSDTDVIYARINGATVAIATGSAGVATDTIFDAKGDLAVGTGADTAQKLSIGTDGTRLVADAANLATHGIGWQAILARTLLPSGNGSTNLTNYNKSVIVGTLTGNYTVNLYSASTSTGNGAGDAIWIKRADTSGYTLTIDASGSETIDGALTITLAPYEAVTLVSDGTNWWRT